MKLKDMPPEERAELEALGWELTDYLENADITPDPDGGEPPLMALRRLRYEQACVEREAADAALNARAQGVSWERIGAAFGIAGETARKRYQRRAVA
ncbi:MAG: hypothetical protein LBK95_04305 [Bifidobacteriaceae bacterium]|jgi:hypothetical protein|nr:hypothetical protein [Bifidobacteriaceae bacterium]